MSMRRRATYCLLWSVFGGAWAALAEQRFPPPEFESGYQLPATAVPPPRALWHEYANVAVLAVCLALACYFVYKRRSRRSVLILSVFSLVYFGFYRRGCICSIGTPQNVALGLFNADYAVPLVVGLFFILPLVVALFAGRTFCAAVCPHGALQDLLLIKPVKVPLWLEQALSVLPYFYLGTALFLAGTGATFLVCRYDPFVPFFRLSGSLTMLLFGAGFVVLSMFVGRPYCRFLCPYGALLKLAALMSKWRVRITPDFCTKCRLCEDACPFGAIREPIPAPTSFDELESDRRRFAVFALMLPGLVVVGALLGNWISKPASLVHPTVALAERYLEPDKPALARVATPDILALERAEQDPQSLLTQAAAIKQRFGRAGWWFGGWIGLVIGIRLITLTMRFARQDYEPDRGACVACGRCYLFCPNERVRLGLLTPTELAGIRGAAVETEKETSAAQPK